jgi:hypothetical protein
VCTQFGIKVARQSPSGSVYGESGSKEASDTGAVRIRKAGAFHLLVRRAQLIVDLASHGFMKAQRNLQSRLRVGDIAPLRGSSSSQSRGPWLELEQQGINQERGY